jgi:hypothetical protein
VIGGEDYNPSTGESEFHTTDGSGGMSLLRKYTGWRTRWRSILPGGFGRSARTDLRFYQR